jgi:hypothetical protein
MGLEDSLVQLLAVMLPQSIPVDAKMSRYVVLSDTKCHRAFDNGPSLFIRLVGGLPPLLTGTGAFSSVMRVVTRKTYAILDLIGWNGHRSAIVSTNVRPVDSSSAVNPVNAHQKPGGIVQW